MTIFGLLFLLLLFFALSDITKNIMLSVKHQKPGDNDAEKPGEK